MTKPDTQTGGDSRTGSLTDRAYTFLKTEIISGRIMPGSLVDAGEIAQRIGMSKTPVRESILRLANEGVLEVNPRRGVRVVPVTADDLHAIYEVITAIEVEAVSRLTLSKPGRKDLKPLIEQVIRMRVATETEDGEAWNLADEAFHRGLMNLCGNPRLAEAGNTYRDMAQRAHFVALRLVSIDQKTTSTASHSDLLETILTGDAAHARHVHRRQRERGDALLVEALRKIGMDQF